MKLTPDELREQYTIGDEFPSDSAIAFAEKVVARATIQPGKTAFDRLRLAMAFELDRVIHEKESVGISSAQGLMIKYKLTDPRIRAQLELIERYSAPTIDMWAALDLLLGLILEK